MTTNDVDLRFLVMREKYPVVYKRARDAVLEGHRLHMKAGECWAALPIGIRWKDLERKPYHDLRRASDRAFAVFHELYWSRQWLRSLGSRKYVADKWLGGHP